VEIRPSARRHGISDEDMRHAVEHAIRVVPVGDVDMFIGGDRTGRLLEVGVVYEDDGARIIHAMPARDKFLR
jgi:GNAT superfamily N-acetyltransferase